MQTAKSTPACVYFWVQDKFTAGSQGGQGRCSFQLPGAVCFFSLGAPDVLPEGHCPVSQVPVVLGCGGENIMKDVSYCCYFISHCQAAFKWSAPDNKLCPSVIFLYQLVISALSSGNAFGLCIPYSLFGKEGMRRGQNMLFRIIGFLRC